MAVEYRLEQKSNSNDEFSTTLRETHELFKQNHVSILGEGIKDVLSDNTLFEQYIDKLTEGLDPTEGENVRQLMENARTNTFIESTTSGIQPVASLTFPMIRKLWARTGLVKVIPTEVVKTNAFSVSFNKPYIMDEAGEKHYLPEAIKNDKSGLKPKKNLSEEALTLPLDDYDLLADVGCSKATGDTIDRTFWIEKAIMEIDGKEIEVRVPRTSSLESSGMLDTNQKIYTEVKYEDETTGDVTVDTIMGYVDLSNGTMKAISLKGIVTKIFIRGYVASDAHNRATNISFDIDRRDFTIGTGEHFEASLPIEFLQDAMATYQIDGTTEVVDSMSNVVAQKLDLEIAAFLNGMYEGTNEKYLGTFDLRPSAGFAGMPKDWREEIKTVIDYFATKIKSESYAYQGYFVLLGNPVDMMIIPNVNWIFNHTVDTQSGVEVDYNLGAISGQNKYSLVSSDLLEQGELTMLFIPGSDKFKTATYYPYTFNVVNNYLNTQRASIPNIMMTKRHTIEEFLPLIGKIKILNNTGDLLSNLPR